MAVGMMEFFCSREEEWSEALIKLAQTVLSSNNTD